MASSTSIATTISVDGVCEGLKMRFYFWPLVDNLYQIVYAVLAVCVTPIVAAAVAFVYFLTIWIVRPSNFSYSI